MSIYDLLKDLLGDDEDGIDVALELLDRKTARKLRAPRYRNGEYICPICEEPWDAYEVRLALRGEDAAMTKEEAEKFMRGLGCPACHFGKRKRKTDDNTRTLEDFIRR
jgi:hypothetical protein